MQLALRPFTTAGIALVGAGVIAVSPLAPPPAITATHTSTASVALTASSSFVDPIGYWAEVFATTQANVAKLVDAASADPFPVLNQIIENQARYANTIGTALSSAADGLYQWTVESIERRLPEVMNALAQGDLLTVSSVIKPALTSLGVALVGMLPLLAMPYNIAQNVANVLKTMVAQGASTGIIGKPAFGLIALAQTMVHAVATVGQELIDAVEAGDPVTAFGSAVNAPAFLTDALLNGQEVTLPNGAVRRTPGLLSFDQVAKTSWSLGSALLVHIPQAIAAAITPPATPVATTANPLALATTPTQALPAGNSPADAPATGSAPESAPTAAASALDDSPEQRADVTTDTTSAVSVSSTGTTELSDGTKTETGKAATTASRQGQKLKASLKNAADQVDKGIKKLSSNIEKSVKKVSDGISKVGKKKAAATSSASSTNDNAGSGSDD